MRVFVTIGSYILICDGFMKKDVTADLVGIEMVEVLVGTSTVDECGLEELCVGVIGDKSW